MKICSEKVDFLCCNLSRSHFLNPSTYLGGDIHRLFWLKSSSQRNYDKSSVVGNDMYQNGHMSVLQTIINLTSFCYFCLESITLNCFKSIKWLSGQKRILKKTQKEWKVLWNPGEICYTLVLAGGRPNSNFLFFRIGLRLPPVLRLLCHLSLEIPSKM